MLGWYLIYEKLCLLPTIKINKLINIPKEKPILCLLADGGYDNWTGSDIEKNGMGGSETFIIEIAQYLVEKYDVCVFCKCNNEETYKNVKYIPIIQYASFITENYIESCIISRFSEYLPLSYKGLIENIYFIMHDLGPSINIIIDNYKLKRIFCLTEWHVEYFLAMYPIFKGKTSAFSYGINETFIVNKDVIKRPLSFIYSSFPNRGLLPLLKMWKRIIDKYPLATLNIYCDLDQKWVNNVCPDTIKEIKELLNDATTTTNVINHGWVDKSILASAWKESEYWLYPCTFLETFCLTALESASSRTLAITAKLGALINTVDDRGLMIEGDPNTIEWQNNCLSQLFEIIENPDKKKELLDKNWLNSKEQTWGKRAKDLLMNYLDKNVLEYKFMGNWTSDIPSGTKKDFENILDLFNKSHLFMSINILEIGTYTGTSLIHIAEKIKNLNNIYAIDLWENYKEIDIYSDLTSYITELEVENSFYKNMIKFGYNPIVYKGKSTDMLFQLIKENKMMDLIYVDASHNEYDFMYDVLLSWKILNRGGYLILDDVMSNIKLVDGLNYFIKENKVKILWSNYRVFLEKI
jgi:hypothetical protein